MEVFSHQLMKIKASGLSDRLMNRYLENSKCQTSAFNEIRLENIILAFVVVASGAVASILSLTFEAVLKKWKDSWKKQPLMDLGYHR